MLNSVALGLAVAMLLGGVGCSSSSKSKNNGLEDGSAGISDQDLSIDKSRFAGGNIPMATEGQQFPDVHFDYDSAVVRQEDYEVVRNNAKLMASDPNLQMDVEGHCDKRGTAEYNLALGEERAKAVAALLVNYGAKPDQLSTISYGEEIPLDPRDSDDAYAKNRRVHFAVYRKKVG
ncbi:MAG: OmpA family protein [Bdellovibrionota bacterium]